MDINVKKEHTFQINLFKTMQQELLWTDDHKNPPQEATLVKEQ